MIGYTIVPFDQIRGAPSSRPKGEINFTVRWDKSVYKYILSFICIGCRELAAICILGHLLESVAG